MTMKIKRTTSLWTVIHNLPEARNAMDPASADGLAAVHNEGFDGAARFTGGSGRHVDFENA